jgi:hypothetical protein
MPTFIASMLFSLGRLIGVLIRKMRESRPRPICTECSFAHVQFATSGKQKVFCTFGGGVRPVECIVMFCTDFRDRSLPTRSNVVVGFVAPARELEAASAKAEAGR